MLKNLLNGRKLLKRTLPILLAPVLLTSTLSTPAMATPPSFNGKHFIKISTHGAPVWDATAILRSYDKKTKRPVDVYRWHESHSASYALWQFKANPGDWIEIGINSVTAQYLGQVLNPLDRDYCFLVTAGSTIKYTGDSVTGNCTAA